MKRFNKTCIVYFISSLFFVTLVGLWRNLTKDDVKTALSRASGNYNDDRKARQGTATFPNKPPACTGCRDDINKMLKGYSLDWAKNEETSQKYRSLLITNCNGFQKGFMTQRNSPLRSTIKYDGQSHKRKITEDLFTTFPKDVPFSDQVLDTCAVVGNGAILTNSSCGEAINSAQFVIRCNLPPLENGHSKHVGKKTSLVTANPSIFIRKYNRLVDKQREFVDDMNIYGEALLFLPAFSYIFATDIVLRAHHALEDLKSPMKAVFMNPDYLKDLSRFWQTQGVPPRRRLSSGLMMVSLALEMCNKVDVFGFWPFGNHPYEGRVISNHYYDDLKPKDVHAMPSEFSILINLHKQGVLRLHLGQCLSPQ